MAEVPLMAFVLVTIWMWLTFVTLLIVRLCHSEVGFNLLLCVLVFGSLPRAVAWSTYTLRHRSRRAYHIWQGVTLLMLTWMSTNVWVGLSLTCRLAWWQTSLAVLPFLVAMWAAGIGESWGRPGSIRSVYSWQRMAGKHIILYTPRGKTASEITIILQGCEETLKRVVALLEVVPLTFRVEVFLFPDLESLRKGNNEKRMTGIAHAHGDSLSAVYQEWETLHAIIAHELAHVVSHQRLTPNLLPLLNEGLAGYVEGQIVPDQSRSGIVLPTSLYVLAQPAVFYDWCYTELPEHPPWRKYLYSQALVEYLVQSYGLDKFKQLCVEVGRNPKDYAGERLTAAVKAVYGLNLADLEQQWRGSGETQEGRATFDTRMDRLKQDSESLERKVESLEQEALFQKTKVEQVK